MKTNTQTWIILALLTAIALLIFFWPQTGTSDREKVLNRENVSLLYKIDSMAKVNRAALNEAKEDSLRGIQIQDSLKVRLNAKSNEVIRLKNNPIVIRVREEVPEVDSLIVAQDSVIVLGEQRIAAYEHQLGKLQVSMVGITANFEGMLSAERQRYANSQEVIALKDKELKKSKRANRWTKVGAVALGAVGLLIGSQL